MWWCITTLDMVPKCVTLTATLPIASTVPFVPVDSVLPTDSPVKGALCKTSWDTPVFADGCPKTENVTVVLDSCHSGGGTRGNIRVRSRDWRFSTPSQLRRTSLSAAVALKAESFT
jgi:hypothetical protein